MRCEKMMDLAYKVSFLADRNSSFKLGCVAAKGSRPIAFGANIEKSHPRDPKRNYDINPSLNRQKRRYMCAEVNTAIHLISLTGSDDLSAYTFYVIRRKADGSRGIAKPCKFCENFLFHLNVKEVFYTDENGEIKKLILRGRNLR